MSTSAQLSCLVYNETGQETHMPEVGDGKDEPPEEVVQKVNQILGNLKEGFGLK